jgi:hypothetical protein
MEEFRIIENFNNYSVSNYGNVRNDLTGRLLKPQIGSHGYPSVVLRYNNISKQFLIHRLVAIHFLENPDNKNYVDHIDGNKYFSRIENLRWATLSENQHNRRISSNNSTGVKGVYFDNQINKYRAQITIDNRKIHIGIYRTLEQAKNARQNKAREVFGDFLNECERELFF